MTFVPKSGKLVSNSGFVPQSGRLVTPSSQTQPDRQSQAVDVASGLANFLGFGKTVGNIALSALTPGLGAQATAQSNLTDEQIKAQRLLAEQARKTNDPAEKQRLLNQSRLISAEMGQQSDALGRDIENIMQAGSVTEADLGRGGAEFALRRGVGQTGELFSALAPGTDEFKALQKANQATRGGRIATAGAQGTLQGLGRGVASASEAESFSEAGGDVTGSTLAGGATGAALQTAMEAPGFAYEKFIKNKLKNVGKNQINRYTRTLKQNKANERFYKQAGGKEQVAKEAIALDFPKTQQGTAQELERFKPEFNIKVEAALSKNNRGGVDLSDEFSKAIADTKKEIIKEFGSPARRQGRVQEAIDFLDNIDNTMKGQKTADSLNRIRLDLDDEVGSIPFDEVKDGITLAQKELASRTRDIVKEQVPELKPLFRRYQLLSGLSNAMKIEPAFGITEIAATSPGILAALLSGNVAGLGIGLGSVGVARAARSPGLKRSIATGLSGLGSGSVQSITPNVVNPLVSSVAVNQAEQRRQALLRLLNGPSPSENTQTR